MCDAFHKACRLGDTSNLTSLLNTHPELLNQTDIKLGWSPLYRSVVCNQQNSVKILLEQGADPNIQNRLGESPLHQASYNNFVEILRMLLEKGANPNLAQNDGDTPLHLACMRGHRDVVDLLLKFKADPSKPNRVLCKTPIDYAIEHNHNHIIQLMQQKKSANCQIYFDSPINLTKESTFEPESEKTSRSRLNFPSQLLTWLTRHKLESTYELLLLNGYEDLSHLIGIMHSSYPLTLSTLEKLGISKPGTRMRLLAYLEEEQYKNNNTHLAKSLNWCSNIPQSPGITFSFSIEEFLDGLGLKKLTEKFVKVGFEEYDQILGLVGTKYEVNDEVLEKVVGICKIGYRQRILARMKADAGLSRSKGLSIEKEEMRSACECTIV